MLRPKGFFPRRFMSHTPQTGAANSIKCATTQEILFSIVKRKASDSPEEINIRQVFVEKIFIEAI
jgi:hypothetical protein